jgi:hypothetical protein
MKGWKESLILVARRIQKPAFWTVCVVLVMVLLFHVVLLLLFIRRSDRTIRLWEHGRWCVTVRPSETAGLYFWSVEGWAPFGKREPMYGLLIGWACYSIARNPPTAEIFERLKSDDYQDLVGAMWCLIRIPNPTAKERLAHLLTDERVLIRHMAASALWKLRDDRALALLEKDAASTDTFTATNARALLSLMK